MIMINLLKEEEMSPYWAAYFNMARHNFFTTLVFIGQRTGLYDEVQDKENQIDRMTVLSKDISSEPEKELALRKLLFTHFPFLKYDLLMSKGDVENPYASINDLRQVLKQLSYTLNYYRNYHSHTRHLETRGEDVIRKSLESESRTASFMTKIMTISVREIRNRFKADANSNQKGMVDADSFKFITDSRYIKAPGSDRHSLPSFPDEEDPIMMVINPRHFLCPSYTDKEYSINRGFPERLNSVGKLQLLCLFLEKKYITELLVQSKFLSSVSDRADAPRLSKQRLLLEVMSALRIRLPQNKIDSTEDDVQVALDMLNELKKCPRELYELLGPEDRALFSITSQTGEQVLLRRSDDRFTQLALRWFDTTKAFKALRFQVNAGVFRFLFNDSKKCLDGKTRIRVLQEPLNGFGRIQEVEDMRQAKIYGKNNLWEGFDIKGYDAAPRNDSECLPYINDTRTRYLLDGDNIGMRFGDCEGQTGDYIPEIIHDGNRYRVPCEKAQCTISRFEIPAMLFYHYLNPGVKGELSPVEILIADTVSGYIRFFSDVRDGKLLPEGLSEHDLSCRLLDGYGIKLADIPDKIAGYLLGSLNAGGGFKAYKSRLIECMKESTEFRIRRFAENLAAIRSDMNKPGKPGFVQIKPGSLASFLIRDITALQDGTAEEKMTGLNYSIVQGILAAFGSRDGSTTSDLNTIFRAAGLITGNGSMGSHPFLCDVMARNPRNTVELYKYYLLAKKRFLEGTIPDTASFLHPERAKWALRDEAFFKSLAARYLERPIVLPRQLFEDKIRKKLLSFKDEYGIELSKEIMEATEKGRCNTTFMIHRYFETFKGDYPQPFYGVHFGEFDEGDSEIRELDHRNGYRFHTLVRKHIKLAKTELGRLKSDKTPHTVYIRELSKAIAWASANPLPQRPMGRVRPVVPSIDEFSKKLKKSFLDYTETEKVLRRYVVQDELMFLTATKDIVSKFSLKGYFMLCDIFPTSDSILDKSVSSIRTKQRIPLKAVSNNTVVIKDIITCTIEQNDIKIKDYPEIHKLLCDGRLPSLLVYHQNDTIKADDLKEELAKYDQHRVGLFKSLMDYEKNITDGITDRELSEKRLVTGSKDIDFKVMQAFDNVHDGLTKETLRQIRNGVSHNFYPAKRINRDGNFLNLHDASVPGTAESIFLKVGELSSKKEK